MVMWVGDCGVQDGRVVYMMLVKLVKERGAGWASWVLSREEEEGKKNRLCG